MTIFLLIISFILDGILLIGLFILSTRIKKTEELELRQKEIASEIEGMFSSYLMEIKEENNRMGEWVRGDNHQMEPHRKAETKVEQDKPPVAKQSEPQNREVYQPPLPEEKATTYQPSVQSQILELRKNGYSLDEIAKRLDRGKTEIELLLKFHQKN
ncbi:coupling factor for flagellin transcription and translation [Halobacillus locisalis]|uniref:Coupling factor for flagellin transcription and translation n=1 Tax=Halobacillus locisalis TaxID=220753 RepID=A0A838CQD9_9BACI|nr:coupling factor for flagellin transcription and translation [Halobacillus locisalis]MBA2174083.1 coupling factor for flagellin transcription and translation [Halobacillus locisalis]